MKDMDISEYSYKNGFDKGSNEAIQKIVTFIREKIDECKDQVDLDSEFTCEERDLFNWGRMYSYHEVLKHLGYDE